MNDSKRNDAPSTATSKKGLRLDKERVRAIAVKSGLQTGEFCDATCWTCCKTIQK
jgi:hypothetical protein